MNFVQLLFSKNSRLRLGKRPEASKILQTGFCRLAASKQYREEVKLSAVCDIREATLKKFASEADVGKCLRQMQKTTWMP